MSVGLTIGDVRNDYVVEEEVYRSNAAFSYRARHGNRPIFLKQRFSPKPDADWYYDYIYYHENLMECIADSPAKDFTYEFIDFFEATRPPHHRESSKIYYQAFEWIEGSMDLAKKIEEFRADPKACTWNQRLNWAKVIMAGVKQLHALNIVLSDLKPENLLLKPEPRIKTKFRLIFIDFDWCLFANGHPPPWDTDDEGYFTTYNWSSPEQSRHRSERPTKKSDVFTCGLILYDLLCQGNPYRDMDEAEWEHAVLNFSAPYPELEGSMPMGNDSSVREVLLRCLQPEPNERPGADEVHQVLLEKSLPQNVSVATSPIITSPPSPSQAALTLTHDERCLSLNISTKLSAFLVRQFGEDSQYWDEDWQMTTEKRKDGWYLLPNGSATNETVLNGMAVTSPTRLCDGDVIGVGRESKGIVKLPLKVHIS